MSQAIAVDPDSLSVLVVISFLKATSPFDQVDKTEFLCDPDYVSCEKISNLYELERQFPGFIGWNRRTNIGYCVFGLYIA